ncbi:hypothetical protein T281_13830 [Rhodomicrobium udaipurense JA643]|uniref:Uncharacterized protein n=1 Tax=Rhodomicrobium udaipurense TaxID=1202716 RepID=A0A8I1GHN4_9HYPH|nr:hypothetical protein [Rhodomicrobium udaipurense]KAI93934.1 hypothetical protein T281_13830 [Rhodomicrobium udaipurense JA643]MBJ7543247.1 hypothetical protein [Rhodomicrobium udaipurense]
MARRTERPDRLKIDIEKLLDWTYRVQKVERAAAALRPRAPVAALPSALGQYVVLGTRVDQSSHACGIVGLASEHRGACDDALIVHDAVLALADMWLEWADFDQVEIWDRERLARDGQIVEQRSGAWWRLPAVTIGNVEPMPARVEQACAAAIVIINAKNGTRPEAYEDWAAQRGATATDSGVMDRWGRGRKARDTIRVDEVMHARAIYLVWHAALEMLAAQLDGALSGFEVTGPEAQAEPWIGARGSRGRVLEGVRLQKSERDKPIKLKRKK